MSTMVAYRLSENTFSVLGYSLLGVIFFAWIGFLFLDAKFPVQSASQTNSDLFNASWASETGSISSDTLASVTARSSDDGSLVLVSSEKNPVSLEEIADLDSLKEKILLLERQLDNESSLEFKQVLLEAYLLDNNFLGARKLYYSLSKSEQEQMNPDSEFKILFNSFNQILPNEYEKLKTLLTTLKNNGVFDEMTQNYYQANFLLAEGKYAEAKPYLEQLKTSRYSGFVEAIENVFVQYQSFKDVPSYYQEGLIAYQLMQAGSYALAKKVAIPLANQYENYILPHQILAQVDYLFQRREAASVSYQKLLKIDPSQKNNYLYHLGILNYQLRNYSQAVLYFAQLTENRYILDGDRYLVLSYLALEEEDKALTSWQRLAGHTALKKSDFYSFFEEAFWKPYLLGRSSSYLRKNPQLVRSYLTLCERLPASAQSEVCQYGSIGFQLHQESDISKLWDSALKLASSYAQAGLFLLLGEIANEEWKKADAMTWYLKAFKLASSTEERDWIRSRIASVKAK